MFTDMNERIAQLKLNIRYKSNWEQRLENLKNELEREKHNREQWQQQLAMEERDVERLSRLTLGALFYNMIGKKEEKISQEAEEVLLVKLKLEEAEETVQDLESEIEDLEYMLAGIRSSESDLEQLLVEKKQLIHERHPELAGKLNELTDRETEIQTNNKELIEAIRAGQSVVIDLEHAREQLGSAQDWGTWDMLGGGMISTAIKHGRIDDARSAIHSAQRSLRRFEKELTDVQRDLSIQIDIGGFLTFADFFFDGLISDWIVQGRISESLEQVNSKLEQVRRIVAELNTQQRKAESELYEVLRISSSLIETA
ncbi:hypothetical protein [Paenibacillus abyssi]|uniref:Uncharacterized protein n=1 Tax=Paenibacillus abyssi TaxID=1340531 RepID=A0A917D711_9BACL|nr:hypothetical protein [Paenibacillus abyssi]GGG13237.1 hypothetical protein GCM10010916_32710 [Paenibacillus abyssi]